MVLWSPLTVSPRSHALPPHVVVVPACAFQLSLGLFGRASHAWQVQSEIPDQEEHGVYAGRYQSRFASGLTYFFSISEQKPSPPLKFMTEPVKLLDENLELNTSALEFLHDSSTNYLVVGIIGKTIIHIILFTKYWTAEKPN